MKIIYREYNLDIKNPDDQNKYEKICFEQTYRNIKRMVFYSIPPKPYKDGDVLLGNPSDRFDHYIMTKDGKHFPFWSEKKNINCGNIRQGYYLEIK